jgi:hypothetical protein
MADLVSPLTPDLGEQPGRIRQVREVSETFVAEQKKHTAEALKLDRGRMPAPWRIALSGMAAGAAFFGAGAAFVKILGS